jgi:hypothetical protein
MHFAAIGDRIVQTEKTARMKWLRECVLTTEAEMKWFIIGMAALLYLSFAVLYAQAQQPCPKCGQVHQQQQFPYNQQWQTPFAQGSYAGAVPPQQGGYMRIGPLGMTRDYYVDGKGFSRRGLFGLWRTYRF